jgi:hypothetical protein
MTTRRSCGVGGVGVERAGGAASGRTPVRAASVGGDDAGELPAERRQRASDKSLWRVSGAARAA